MACCGAGQTKPPWPLSSAVKASPKNQLRPGKWLRNRWNLACDTPARAPSETSSPYVSMMSQIRIRWPHFDIDVPRLESHNVAPPPRNLPRPRPIQWLGEKAERDFRKTDQPCITPSHWINLFIFWLLAGHGMRGLLSPALRELPCNLLFILNTHDGSR